MVQLLTISRFPFGLAFSAVKRTSGVITRLIFRSIYEESDALYRASKQDVWRPLSDGLTYKLFLESIRTNNKNPISRIYIRNDSKEVIDSVEICVVAEDGHLEYPETVRVPFLRPSRIARVLLPNILVMRAFHAENGIGFSYDHYRVFVVEISRSGRTERKRVDCGRFWSPHDELLNGKWVRCWGTVYNLDAIEEYKLCWYASFCFRQRLDLFFGFFLATGCCR